MPFCNHLGFKHHPLEGAGTYVELNGLRRPDFKCRFVTFQTWPSFGLVICNSLPIHDIVLYHIYTFRRDAEKNKVERMKQKKIVAMSSYLNLGHFGYFRQAGG